MSALEDAARIMAGVEEYHETYTDDVPSRDDVLGGLIDAVHLIVRHLREAEREATEQPPTPATAEDVMDEPGVGEVVRDRDGIDWARTHYGTWVASPAAPGVLPWASLRYFGPLTLVTPARPTPAPQPDTAPDEGAVEAITDVMADAYAEMDDDPHVAQRILAALDRGAIPGYGPTGASGGLS